MLSGQYDNSNPGAIDILLNKGCQVSLRQFFNFCVCRSLSRNSLWGLILYCFPVGVSRKIEPFNHFLQPSLLYVSDGKKNDAGTRQNLPLYTHIVVLPSYTVGSSGGSIGTAVGWPSSLVREKVALDCVIKFTKMTVGGNFLYTFVTN